MKKIFTTMLLTLAVMAGFAVETADLVYMTVRKTTYNYAEFEWCYGGFNEEGHMGFAIYSEDGKTIAKTVMSMAEIEYVIGQDKVAFPEYDKNDCYYENHYYMSTYWILNSLNGVVWGEEAVKTKYVYENKDNDGHSLMALLPGKYYFYACEIFYTYDSNGGITKTEFGADAQLPFTISSTTVSDLKAEVAADHKTATISWVESDKLPYGSRLYLSVQTGSEIAYDNYAQTSSPKSPLTIGVVEGRTYSVSAQYLNSAKEPIGGQMKVYFTVGTNTFIPNNLKATVVQDDYVEFSWSAASKAEFYHINVYKSGATYASYTSTEMKLTKQIPTGTYTWDVAAYEKDEELYYPLSEYVKGNEFTTKSAALPEGTIQMNVWGMEAVLFEESANRYGWLVEFATGTKNGSGYPMPWFYIYVDRELALSGFYSSAMGNMAISTTQGEDTQMNIDGNSANTIQATSGELKLEFEGFDTEYVMAGYNIPYYGGYFKMTLANGDSYYGEFSGLMCGAYPASEWMAGTTNTVISMLGEDGTVIPGNQAIEDVSSQQSAVSQKVLRDGQIIIVREGKEYNLLGSQIK